MAAMKVARVPIVTRDMMETKASAPRSMWSVEKGWGKRARQGRLVGSEGREVEGAGAKRKGGEAPSGAGSLGSVHRVLGMWLEKKLMDLEER